MHLNDSVHIKIIDLWLRDDLSMENRFIYEVELAREIDLPLKTPIFIESELSIELLLVRVLIAFGKNIFIHSEQRLPDHYNKRITIDTTLRWSNKKFTRKIYQEFHAWSEIRQLNSIPSPIRQALS